MSGIGALNYVNNREIICWPVLLAGVIATLVIALSVHAVMLQWLHVPYPYNFPHIG